MLMQSVTEANLIQDLANAVRVPLDHRGLMKIVRLLRPFMSGEK